MCRTRQFFILKKIRTALPHRFHFANFIKTGNPNSPGMPNWPVVTANAPVQVMRIDVDTQEGRVNLSGKAPDESSKTRATTLAKAVEGVKSVENRLVVGN